MQNKLEIEKIKLRVRSHKLLQNDVLKNGILSLKWAYENEKEFWGQNFTTK